MSTTSKYSLVITQGEGRGQRFALGEGENLIGRADSDSAATIDLEPFDPEAKVSREHALITVDQSKILLKDLGSMNGTFVHSGEPLQGEVQINPGDEIVIGKTCLKLEG